MKFSDMMGKRDRGTTEATEPQLPADAATAPPVPEAPIRLGGNRSELDEAAAAFGPGAVTHEAAAPPPATGTTSFVAAPPTAAAPPDAAPPVAAPPVPTPEGPPSISDVVAELAPRPVAAVTDQQLDTSAWLDGINSIDDDLLPR